ncbi:Abi family protein [Dyadobacter sp. CY347]|uniref:Abi family protein n=1 Tax=Dyadobacter sp. CY347 TaxID=2909336 RepID=UPI001F19928A|nr:Abi family protein [Dyadobacter sp. CY347]MCF2487944.1 Abi family protein [Dyadobacter sp. CY347]
MHFDHFTLYFSESRVARYVKAADGSHSFAQNLYKGNLMVSQAFHPLIGVLEVVLRNRLNDVIADHFKDDKWLLNQRNGFMADPSLIFVHKKSHSQTMNDFLKKDVTNAEKRIKKTKASVSIGKIVAELTFGFWTELFEVHHYKLLFGRPIQVFPALPPGFGRKEVKDTLDFIRRFRNRINHNEPVCFNNEIVDFTYALKVHASILNVLSWIDPQLLIFVSDVDQVETAINVITRNTDL